MPAKTTNQLFSTHGQYLDASESGESDFRSALNEVMPRIYKMGYWREMMVEHTQDASAGYISLPQDTDSIVAAMLDNNPRAPQSLWHDYKLFGTNDQDKTHLNAFIDDGYAPTYRDLVSGSQYKIQYHTLKAPFNVNPATGDLTIKYRAYGDATDGANALIAGATKLEGDSFNGETKTFSGGAQSSATDVFSTTITDVTEILEISWASLEADHPVQVQALYQGTAGESPSTDSTKDLILAQINSNNGSSRYRRFRIGGTNSTSSAHMLLKRRWVDVDSTSDLAYIPSNSILKHALLGKLAEDNADVERATYHWGVVKELLETDTDSYRGAAKPTLQVAPNGVGGGISGMY